MTILLDERAAVARACQELAAKGLVVGTAGNVSVRVGDYVVISPSGVPYDELAPQDVGVHDLSGAPVDAPLAPSSELPLHLAIYHATASTAIVHTHAPASTAMSTVVSVVPPTHYYTAMFGGPVRVAPYAQFGTDELAANVVAALEDRTAALMGNHGAVLVGADLGKTMTLVPYLEYICEVQLRAGTYGTPRVLTDEEIESARVGLSGYGQSGSGSSS